MPASAYRLSVAATGPVREAAVQVEAEVFLAQFGNTREQLRCEYGPYEGSSVFLLITDETDGTPVGAARLITPSPAGLKTLDDLAGPPWGADVPAVLAGAGLDESGCLDVATLAVVPAARGARAGRPVTPALLHGVYACAATLGLRGFLAVLDDRVLRALRRLGVPAAALPGQASVSYLGSPASTPVFGEIRDVDRTLRTGSWSAASSILDGDLPGVLLPDWRDLELTALAPV